MDDSFDLDKCGGNELDDSCLIVGTIYILGMDWFREAVAWEFVLFNKSPIKAID